MIFSQNNNVLEKFFVFILSIRGSAKENTIYDVSEKAAGTCTRLSHYSSFYRIIGITDLATAKLPASQFVDSITALNLRLVVNSTSTPW